LITIERTISNIGKDIYAIIVGGDSFSIYPNSKGDLYWSYMPSDFDELDTASSKTFVITKENYFVYSLFEELYENMKNYNVYEGKEYSKINTNVEYYENLKRKIRDKNENDNKKIVSNDGISWHSEDGDYDYASKLIICKKNDNFEATFVRGTTYLERLTFLIRISNEGCRHAPFNIPFMHMYFRLNEFNPDFVPVHLEEYLYNQSLTRKKESQRLL